MRPGLLDSAKRQLHVWHRYRTVEVHNSHLDKIYSYAKGSLSPEISGLIWTAKVCSICDRQQPHSLHSQFIMEKK